MTQDATVTIRFVRLYDGARAPEQATPGATGFDVFACIPAPGFIDVAQDPVRIPTGIAVEAPQGCDVQLRPRSGLGAQGVMGTVGTLDADYRGEVFVTLYTVGRRHPHRVMHGDRVAQFVIGRAVSANWIAVDSLAATERGAGGHGSTGP